MAKEPKESERHGRPLGVDPVSAKIRDAVDLKAKPAHGAERAKAHSRAVQPLGAAIEHPERKAAKNDGEVHPSGGRRLLESADKAVRPFGPEMVLRG